jgi:Zn ribbon nucleic-acid-binding protein
MVTCPNCGSDDDLELVERLGGDARIIRCTRCGHQWQRGEVPKAADPGKTKDQRLRARFPTIDDVSSKRLEALRNLIADPGRPAWSEHQVEFRDRYRVLFSARDRLSRMTVQDFERFFVSDELANVGPARFAAETTLKELGPEEFIDKVRAALEYLLFEERRPLEQRLTDLVDGHASPALKGVREAILTKVLAAAWPEQIFPALVYDSEDGSGKRQVADALLGLSLPPRDRSDWTIGRLAIWSNDLFVDVAHALGFQDLHSAADFVWWLWKRHQEGDELFPPLIGVEEFADDDDGYLRWVRRHPHGYVLNCERAPRADYLVLHQTACATISGNPARGDAWTKDYMKACGTDRQTLVRWAESRTGAEPALCGICFGH